MSLNGILLYSGRAAAFAAVVALLWGFIAEIKRRRRVESFSPAVFLSGMFFAAYLAALVQITVIRDWRTFFCFVAQPHGLQTIQIIPLKTTLEAWREGAWSFCYHLIGNMIWFIPFGILGSATHTELQKWRILLPVAAGVSFLIEIAQWCFSSGVSDVDDILLNTLGAAVGLALWKLWKYWRDRRV